MDTLFVTGGHRLSGTVRISGAKNSALKLMAASLLGRGNFVIGNVPRIQDCRTMVSVLERLGARVEWKDGVVSIDSSDADTWEAPYELVSAMRASIIVLGPLLARHHRARVAMPGGCNIGSRSIDLHIRGLERMGVSFSFEHGYIDAVTEGLHGAAVSLDYPSVGATENTLMAAVLARGTTIIDNAAREPEIVDLANFLRAMGAQVSGAGSPTIEIEGVDDLRSAERSVLPDRIEAGTYAIATCAARGDVFLAGARAEHLEIVLDKLVGSGADVEAGDDGVRISVEGRLRAADLVTLPYPGFPTDLQPQMMALLATASGTSIATENVFEGRFMFVDELKRMGADIQTEGHHAVVRGVDRLSSAPVRALDIRAGAAMIVAALAADGVTEISDMHFVDRGYEDVEEKLTFVGAEVRRERGSASEG